MSADLFIPIIFIVIMDVIIGCVEDGLTLLAIGALFIPVAFMFAQIVNIGGYTMLFGASIQDTTVGSLLIGGSMFVIPMFAISKIFYLKHQNQLLKDDNKGE